MELRTLLPTNTIVACGLALVIGVLASNGCRSNIGEPHKEYRYEDAMVHQLTGYAITLGAIHARGIDVRTIKRDSDFDNVVEQLGLDRPVKRFTPVEFVDVSCADCVALFVYLSGPPHIGPMGHESRGIRFQALPEKRATFVVERTLFVEP